MEQDNLFDDFSFIRKREFISCLLGQAVSHHCFLSTGEKDSIKLLSLLFYQAVY